MYTRRRYSRNRELDLDVERAALRVALLTNSDLPTYPYYNPYLYLPAYSCYGIPPTALPYLGAYPYVLPNPYLYY